MHDAAHGLVLQGDPDPRHPLGLKAVSLADSAAAKKLFVSQVQELWSRAGQEFARLQQLDNERQTFQGKGPKPEGAKPEEVAANRKLVIELYDKLLPEFRALVPAAEQATFDQNLQKVQAMGYTLNKVFLGWAQCAPERYQSVVHGVVLRGITVSDSAALNKVAFEQMKEIYTKASRAGFELEGKGGAAQDANRKRQRELFDQLLPQLRPLVPANQQTTFDQNLKALQAGDYTVLVTNLPDEMAPKDPKDPKKVISHETPVDVRIGCITGYNCLAPTFGVPFP